MRTPWGASDYSQRYAPGIVFYGTPSHGGFHLTPKREQELDVKLREHGITAEEARMGYAPGWYEEDCSVYAVMFAFDEARPGPTTPEHCLERLRYWIGRAAA